jgi:exopolysaccharide production protein ExoQ
MPPRLAALVFVAGILWLFHLCRQPKNNPASKALWIPVIWLLIAGSRNVGEWLAMSSPMDQGSRYLDGNPIDRAILGALMAMGLAVLVQRLKQVQSILTANFAVLLYFFYCGFSSLWSDYPDVAFKRWFRGVGDLIMVLVILTDDDWLPALKRVLIRVAFWLLPLSVLLIRYYPDLGRGYNIAGSAMFWTGVTTDKNGLGMICLIFGLGIMWQFMDLYQEEKGGKRTKAFYVHGLIVLIMVWLLWESNSMTSISCFVLALGLMVAVGRWKFARKPAVTTIFAGVAVGFSALVLFGGLGFFLEAIGRNPTLTGRTEVWHALLPFSQSPLFGSGYESFWLGDRLTRIGGLISSGINEAHNGYLEIYLNLGWVGLGLLGLVFVAGFKNVLAAIRKDTTRGKVRLAYFIIPLIYNFTEAAFKMMSPVWIFFLIAVMAPPTPVEAENPTKVENKVSGKLSALKPRIDYALASKARKKTPVGVRRAG